MTEPGSNLAERLAAALPAGPVPVRGEDVVEYVGGDRRFLTQVISGREGPAGKKTAYATEAQWREANTAWRTAARRVQRWAAGDGRQRRELARLTARERRQIHSAATAARTRAMRSGFRTRLRAQVIIPSGGARGGDTRVRIMPALGGPGESFNALESRVVLDDSISWEDAAEIYWQIFVEHYGLPEGATVGTVWWLRLWPRGGTEPV